MACHLYDISWWELASQVAFLNHALPLSLPLFTVVQKHDVDLAGCPDVGIALLLYLHHLLCSQAGYREVDGDRV